MIYTFLISIVFIAELIIAIAIIKGFCDCNKKVIKLNENLSSHKSSIKEVLILIKKISSQYVELSEQFIHKLKKEQEEILLKQLSKILMALLLIKFNKGAIKKFRTSKFAKTLSRGLSLLEIMV